VVPSQITLHGGPGADPSSVWSGHPPRRPCNPWHFPLRGLTPSSSSTANLRRNRISEGPAQADAWREGGIPGSVGDPEGQARTLRGLRILCARIDPCRRLCCARRPCPALAAVGGRPRDARASSGEPARDAYTSSCPPLGHSCCPRVASCFDKTGPRRPQPCQFGKSEMAMSFRLRTIWQV
jgi:hypothetical protein